MIPMEQYKGARVEVERIAALIRAALTRAGLSEHDVSGVRGVVSRTGRGFVELGSLRAGVAAKLLEALPSIRAEPADETGPTALR
ncbi:hypothetical protein [Streptomyces sp. NPDC004296]|uniref:hypothetical protein n=1 Tax=Streptomyces sp. NPDC004296 TaxID=3364697 RepID=UPI0036B8B01C